MKWTAALLFLPFLQTAAEPQRPVDPVEPPLRVDLRVGERTVRLELGATVPARDDLPELRAELCPTRSFVAPGAFAFDYPREWAFMGGANGVQGWWSVSADGAMVHMQRHADDPIAARDLYVRNALEGLADATSTDRKLALGGRELAARSVEFTQGSLHGTPASRTRQDVLGFRAGGASWILVVNRPIATPGTPGTPAALETVGGFRIYVPSQPIQPEGAPADLDALIASFRWL